MQREANRIFGYTAKQTLDLAQALYEKRLLTYPRTDSSYLTDDMGGTAAGIIALLCEKLPFMAGADLSLIHICCAARYGLRCLFRLLRGR